MEVRKRRRPIAEINVVPYIDVMLVLLVIFMITAPLITAGVNVDLPNADGKPLETESETPLIASVNKDGLYYLTVGEEQEDPMSLIDLVTLVRAQREVSPNIPVYVNADESVKYGKVVRLFTALQSAGVENTNLMVEPVEEQP